ncbi:MAG: hypothetical protein JO356_05275 [Acidobacteria bacterium]|nr:hypothetical protein [Acidobacteriota bacterium]
MAERAEAVNLDGQERNEGPLFPVRPETEVPPTLPDTLTANNEREASGYEQVKNRAACLFSALHKKSNALVSNLRHWTGRACNERPLQVVAVIAVTGFVIGAILRVWKCKREA